MINNLGTPSSELQINFGVLQIDTENSATGILGSKRMNFDVLYSNERSKSSLQHNIIAEGTGRNQWYDSFLKKISILILNVINNKIFAFILIKENSFA